MSLELCYTRFKSAGKEFPVTKRNPLISAKICYRTYVYCLLGKKTNLLHLLNLSGRIFPLNVITAVLQCNLESIFKVTLMQI